ncbi:hypothetical protein Q5752_004852 [Cryptotrichosporon argae]
MAADTDTRDALLGDHDHAGDTPPRPITSTNTKGSVVRAVGKQASRLRTTLAVITLAASLILLVLAHRALSFTPLRTAKPVVDRNQLFGRVQVLRAMLRQHYIPNDDERFAWTLNDPLLARLGTCLRQDTCSPSERRVIILASMHFGQAMGGHVSGEDIWALSTIEVLTALNYTLVYASGHMDALLIYEHLAPLVSIVIWDRNQLNRCLARNDSVHVENEEWRVTGAWQTGTKGCIARPEYPQGVPLHKVFVWHFWGSVASPLGPTWTLAPENYARWSGASNQYIGYQIESHCKRIPYRAPSERKHRGVVFGKKLIYFKEELAFEQGQLGRAAASVPPAPDGWQTPFELVATAGKGVDHGGPEKLPEPGIISLGQLPREEWLDLVSRSKVLVGIGMPELSPSPYGALCGGVPFINVVKSWDKKDPEDRSKWHCQQQALCDSPPPYVYNVRAGNQTELEEALRAAVSTSIDRFIPPEMEFNAVLERHRRLVETDWLPQAQAYALDNYGDDFPYWIK